MVYIPYENLQGGKELIQGSEWWTQAIDQPIFISKLEVAALKKVHPDRWVRESYYCCKYRDPITGALKV